MSFNLNLNDYYVTLLTIIVTLNSVSIPLSYNIISDNLKPYFDKRFAEYFLEEKDFRDNIVISIWSLPILGLPLLIDFTSLLDVGNDKSITDLILNLYNIFVFVFMAVFIGSFVRFSNLVYQYASNTEEIVYKKIKTEIDEFLKD